LIGIACALSLVAGAGPAGADTPTPEVPNECENPGGQGLPCAADADCAGNAYATRCAHYGAPLDEDLCSIPCEALDEETGAWSRAPALCSMGEVCAAKWFPGELRQGFVCLPVPFRMDLALLDRCIVHFLEGVDPAFTDNDCSLQANLDRLLDQDADGGFDIFDVDLCVLAFLERHDCTPAEDGDLPEGCCEPAINASCMPGDVPVCAADADCGLGLHCDLERSVCQRECGIIASREESMASLERECPGALKLCDHTRGKCVPVDVTQQTCAVDQDCPAGAYCFLGRCAPLCGSSLDCPDTGWFCTQNNRCRALPPPAGEDGFVFDPQNYAIRFARDGLALDAVQTSDASQMVIMDLITKSQIVDNPAVGFGYRLEVTYGLKEDARCLQPFVDCDDPDQLPEGETVAECEERQDDCYVDDTEQWILLASPFGTINAAGGGGIAILLDEAAAGGLSPGLYPATVRVLFDNGDSDSIPVTYLKASPSGRYSGTLTVYWEHVGNALNPGRPLTFDMDLFVDMDSTWKWQDLMDAQNLGDSGTALVDLTEGFLATGRLRGHSALAYSAGAAMNATEDAVPFVGLYSPALNRLRMVGVIEIPAGFCMDEDGQDCSGVTPGLPGIDQPLAARNVFGRTIRRRIELFGPFEDAVARYHGLYRETITGLSPDGAITLSGGFVLDQAVADSTPLAYDLPMLSPPSDLGGAGSETGIPAAVDPFPEDAALLAAVGDEIASWCDDGEPAAAAFADGTAFDGYLAQAVRGETTIFGDLLGFAEVIEVALANLGQDDAGQQAHLNVYDHLSDWIVPCDEDDPSPPPVCIDEARLRCGLALHQRAIIQGWVDMTALDSGGGTPTAGEQDLFCVPTMPTAGCPEAAEGWEDLFAMQEHNRFWRDLARAIKFEGDRSRSDAFLTLLRNAVDPFSAGTALSYKGDALRAAVASYDAVVELIAGTPAAAVLFRWPAMQFKQGGEDWLEIMRTVLEDRMGAISELVDLKRRIYGTADAKDLLFANHLMQQEYLLQVYLMALEQAWRGPLFKYGGEAQEVLEQGQQTLLQLDPSWNPLGVHGNQVFFENSDAGSTNWEHYRDLLVGADGDGGAVGQARETVDVAVENLQASLADLDALEASLQAAKWELEDKLAGICGDPDPGGDGCAAGVDYCQCVIKQFVTQDGWKDVVQACKEGGDCPEGMAVTCSDIGAIQEDVFTPMLYDEFVEKGVGACEEILVGGFLDGLEGSLDPEDGAWICGLDTEKSWVVDALGRHRPCVGGRMGLLLQQKAHIDAQREAVLTSLVDEFQALYDMVQEEVEVLDTENEEWFEEQKFQLMILALEKTVEFLETFKTSQEEWTEVMDCWMIVGFSNGTNCATHPAVKATDATLEEVLGAVQTVINMTIKALQLEKDISDWYEGWMEARQELKDAIEEQAGSSAALVSAFEALTQDSFDLYLQIEDLRWQAQHALDRYGEEVTFVAEHLVGRESGSLLRGEAEAREATESFRDLVLLSYKMAMAFIHQYNLPPGQAQALVEQALAAVTIDDVEDFALDLWEQETEYCGFQGIDCDSGTNVEVLRFSMRELMFPHLTDVIDAQTGKVVTAGQRFHNMITAPPYLKRRIRGTMPTDQVEIPVGLPLTMMENLPGGDKWLINPLTCNHLLDARDPDDPAGTGAGNVAVNVEGINLGDGSQGVRYELVRGPTDYLRSCTAESVQEEVGTLPVLQYPIRTYTVGYAPHNPNAEQQSPPAYTTHSASFPACVNLPEAGGLPDDAGCWRYYARDRSLSSLDWKLVIPLYVDGAATDNAWLAGEGLPAEEKPIIEDVVLYFRYRTRAIQE